MTSDPSIKVLGIGAWDRSGSTVIANVMGAVPGVVSVGEINNLWQRGLKDDRLCSCGDRFSACAFWKPVIDRAFPDAAGNPVLAAAIAASDTLTNGQLLRHRLTGRPWPQARAYAEGLRALYRAIAEISGSNVIVDSAKMPWHLQIASNLDDIDFSLLHLVRHPPRGVTQALRKKVPYDPDSTRPELMDRHGTVYTALGWRYRNLILAGLWRGRGVRYRFERYEDFAADPAASIRRILDLIGHPSDLLPFVSPNEAVIPPTHSVSGNPARFATGPVRIALDNEWQSKLSRRRRLLVEALTWPMLTRYGYGE